jgi:hypothetical protein
MKALSIEILMGIAVLAGLYYFYLSNTYEVDVQFKYCV